MTEYDVSVVVSTLYHAPYVLVFLRDGTVYKGAWGEARMIWTKTTPIPHTPAACND